MEDLEEDQLISGKFRVLDLLGRDQSSNEYKVQEGVSKDVFTVKVFHITGASQLDELRAQIEQLKKLDHPNIAKIRHHGTLPDGRAYMLLEPVDGVTLADVIRKQSFLTQTQTIQIGLQVCDALTHALDRGVLLRDLSTNDVTVSNPQDPVPEVKIVDFADLRKLTRIADQRQMVDLAYAMNSDDSIYRSPEEFSGAHPDIRSSIYSLGIIMFECLAGKPPFSGISYSEIANKHMRDRVPALSGVRTDHKASAHMEIVLQKCLAKLPEQRYQTPTEVRADLYRLLEGQSPTANIHPAAAYAATPGQSGHDSTPLWIAGIAAILISLPIIFSSRVPSSFDFDLFGSEVKGNKLEVPEGLSPLPTLRKGEELDAQGNESQALRFYKLAADKARKTSDAETAAHALLRLSQIMRNKENYPQSELLAHEALAISAEDRTNFNPLEAKCFLTMVLCDLEKYREAERVLDTAQKTASPAGKVMIDQARAHIFEQEGKLEQAEASLASDLPKLTGPQKQDAVHELASFYLRHGRFAEAQALVTPEIRGNGPLLLACDLTASLLGQKQLSEAARLGTALYTQDIADHHVRTEVARLYAVTLAAQGNHKEALELLKTYADIRDTDDVAATIDLAHIQAGSGQTEGALKVLDVMATRTQWQKFLVACAKAEILLKAKQYQQAERAIDLATAAYDQSAKKDNLWKFDMLKTRVQILEGLGKTTEAAEAKKQMDGLEQRSVFLDPASLL